MKDVTTVSFSFSPVNSDDINEVFRSLTPKSSTGLDDLSSKMLKLIQDSLTPILCVTINQSLINGIFPEKLKYAKVKPLYKKDDATVFTNYRPISLLPAISKIFEKIVHKQVYDYFVTNNLFYASQYGYRKKHSTEHAVLELVDRIHTTLENGESSWQYS